MRGAVLLRNAIHPIEFEILHTKLEGINKLILHYELPFFGFKFKNQVIFSLDFGFQVSNFLNHDRYDVGSLLLLNGANHV